MVSQPCGGTIANTLPVFIYDLKHHIVFELINFQWLEMVSTKKI